MLDPRTVFGNDLPVPLVGDAAVAAAHVDVVVGHGDELGGGEGLGGESGVEVADRVTPESHLKYKQMKLNVFCSRLVRKTDNVQARSRKTTGIHETCRQSFFAELLSFLPRAISF